MFDAPRRRRRRRLIWPLLITLVIAVGLVVATAGSDTRETISYLEEVRSVSIELSRSGSTLSGLVADLSRVERSEFETVVGTVEDALVAAHEVAEREAPSDELVGAAVLFRIAVESWMAGIEGFSEALLRAADQPQDESATDDLASAVVLVRAGDQIYGALLEEFERDDVPSPVGEMPQIRLLPVDASVTVVAPAWVSAARSESSQLPIRPSIRIEQVSTQPQWVQSADGSVVVPATETIDVIVVVANGGNTDTAGGRLELVLQAAEEQPVTRSQPVPVIGPGRSTSLVFQDLQVAPGVFYQLDLNLDPQGPDIFPEDNRHSTGFLINEATATDTTDTTDNG